MQKHKIRKTRQEYIILFLIILSLNDIFPVFYDNCSLYQLNLHFFKTDSLCSTTSIISKGRYQEEIFGKITIFDEEKDLVVELTKQVGRKLELPKETLLADEGQSHFYGEFGTKTTEAFDEFSVLVGGQLGWTFNHAFSIGFAAYARAEHENEYGCGDWNWDQTRLNVSSYLAWIIQAS